MLQFFSSLPEPSFPTQVSQINKTDSNYSIKFSFHRLKALSVFKYLFNEIISSVLYQMGNIEVISYLHSYEGRDQQNAAHAFTM